jgi:hypothetical protein
MGLGLASVILTVAGMLRVSFVRYVTINVLCGIVWILFLMGIGYYFGNLLQYVPKDFQIGIAIALPFAFFFTLKTINKKLAALDW